MNKPELKMIKTIGEDGTITFVITKECEIWNNCHNTYTKWLKWWVTKRLPKILNSHDQYNGRYDKANLIKTIKKELSDVAI